MITVEYDPIGEVQINCDNDGAKELIKLLQNLVNEKDTHYI